MKIKKQPIGVGCSFGETNFVSKSLYEQIISRVTSRFNAYGEGGVVNE